jgi:imidazolonepropionase-like amidohydrolase
VRRGPALGHLGVIEDGSVLIRDGLIAAVGTSRRIENLKAARNAIDIPVNGSIVIPGFVDASLNLSVESDTGQQSLKTEERDRVPRRDPLAAALLFAIRNAHSRGESKP